MSFSQEIKDFTGSFEKGWKLATPTYAEIEERKRREEAEGVKAAGDAEEGRAGGRRVSALPISGASDSDASTPSSGKLPSFAQGDLLSRAQAAISGVESGGRYDAVGPTHKTMGRALGKYQVMESNIPEWSRKALGYEITPDQFLKDPKAQDAIFNTQFGGYLKKYGTVEDAASAWHSGRPLAKAAAAGARDSLGTKTTDYARRVSNAVGKRAEAAIPLDDELEPTQMAAGGGLIERLHEDSPPVRERYFRDEPRVWVDPPARTSADRDMAGSAERVPAGLTRPPVDEAYDEQDTRALEGSPSVPVAETPQAIRAGDLEQMRAAGISTAPAGRKVTQTGKRSAIPLDGAPTPPRRPADSQLNDSGAPLPGEGMTADSDEPYNPRALVHTPGIGDAIEAGLREIGKAFGFSQDSAAIPEAREGRAASLERFNRNEGAASPSEIRAIDKTIDPRGELSDDERAVARLYGGYKYFLSKGEPEKAAKYSKSILQYTRLHVQTAGAVAQHRLEEGDVAGATRAMSEASSQIPNGTTVKFTNVSKAGADYAMYDEDGELTDKGTASVNQLLAKAAGMRNGSEWLDSLNDAKGKSLTAAQKLKAKREEADIENLGKFEANSDSGFQQSLNDEQKAAFSKLSPRVQGQVVARWRNEQKLAQNEQRLTDSQKKSDAKTAAAEKDALTQQEYAGHIDKVRDAKEALDAQMQDNPQDEAKVAPLRKAFEDAKAAASNWTAGDAGRGKYVPALNRELRSITRGGSGASAGGSGSGGTGGARGGSAEERQASALDAQYAAEANRVRAAGNKPEDVARLAPLKAQIEFKKRDTGYDDAMEQKTDPAIQKALGVDDLSKAPQEEVLDHRDAVTGILRGDNALSAEHAVALTRLAAKTGRMTLMDDGKYKIGDARPVYISPEGVEAMKRIARREAAKNAPKTVGNPFFDRKPDASPAEQQAAAEKAAQQETRVREGGSRSMRRNMNDFANLRNALGDSYSPGMTLAEMRRALSNRPAAPEDYTGPGSVY